jgi:hypothetical protein
MVVTSSSTWTYLETAPWMSLTQEACAAIDLLLKTAFGLAVSSLTIARGLRTFGS